MEGKQVQQVSGLLKHWSPSIGAWSAASQAISQPRTRLFSLAKEVTHRVFRHTLLAVLPPIFPVKLQGTA